MPVVPWLNFRGLSWSILGLAMTRHFTSNRFPKWMWKNEVMPPFIEWLKQHNQKIVESTNDPAQAVSFYGMDLYSLHRSAQQVIEYLQRVDPEGAKAARKKWATVRKEA